MHLKLNLPKSSSLISFNGLRIIPSANTALFIIDFLDAVVINSSTVLGSMKEVSSIGTVFMSKSEHSVTRRNNRLRNTEESFEDEWARDTVL